MAIVTYNPETKAISLNPYVSFKGLVVTNSRYVDQEGCIYDVRYYNDTYDVAFAIKVIDNATQSTERNTA